MTHKEAAVEFLQLVVANKVREAYQRYVAPKFRHHNPYFKGDGPSLMKGMEENAAKNPNKVLNVKSAVAEGDRVVVFSHIQPKTGDSGVAAVHIFRFEGMRIAELWDIGQPVQEKSVNENGMF